MFEFKGFDDWVPIFAGGKQRDSQGRMQDGDALIDKAIASFDAEVHEPPLVVGHPKDNDPAYGWIGGLKKAAQKIKGLGLVNVLLMKTRDVVPEFAAAVKQNLYKKRSASFYPDGRLRHVGFLGAAPPAVKGLPNLAFKEEENTLDFNDIDAADFTGPSYIFSRIATVFSRLRDRFIEKDGLEEADKIISSWDIDNLKDEANRAQTAEVVPTESAYAEKKEENSMGYTEEQLQTLLQKQKDRDTKNFTEKLDAATTKTEQDVRNRVEAEFAEKEAARAAEVRKKEIKDFIDQGVKDGKIIPAWVKMGMAEFMENLAAEETMDFMDGKKRTSLDWFRDFMAELPKVVEFKEIATRDQDAGSQGTQAKRDKLISDFQESEAKAGRIVSYKDAVITVSAANQELFEEDR